MIITVQRRALDGDALMGEITIDGTPFGCSLENGPKAILPGVYPVVLTPSARAESGQLFTPNADYLLPLVCNVTGRSGIRLHSLNTAGETEGCIGVGTKFNGTWLSQSQPKLMELMKLLIRARLDKESVELHVIAPVPTAVAAPTTVRPDAQNPPKTV